MKLNLTIPSHITHFEISTYRNVILMCSLTGKNHVQIERQFSADKAKKDTYYLQSVVNEIAEALR